MRYIFLVWIIVVGMVVGIAGFQGDKTRRTPIELFPDMDRQPKLRPQTANDFFPDGRSSQLAPEGTIARHSTWEKTPENTGRVMGTTNFVSTIPLPVDASLLAKGQAKYTVYCTPCHGATGDGKGVTSKLGMGVIGDIHDHKGRKLITAPDGQIFDTIGQGKGLMGGYGSVLSPQERWAVVAYVRALQLAKLGSLDDIPNAERASIK